MEYFTKQTCKKCGETMEIDAMDFLMNLDKIDSVCICDKCKELEKIKKEETENEIND